MKRRYARKGYFFLIDSMLALGVLVIGSFLVFSTYTKIPSKEGVELLSEDVMDFFADTKISGVNNEYAGVGGQLWDSGLISNADNSLLQQLGEFYEQDNLDIAEQFILSLTENSIPPQFLFEFRIEDTLLYPQNPSQSHLDSKDRTQVLIPSKKIVHGYLDENTGDLFGPYDAEVLVWKTS